MIGFSGDANIHGPYFIYPAEVEHQPTRMFYHQEVFRSSIEETNQASSIISLCAVLSYRDYTTCRSDAAVFADAKSSVCFHLRS